MWGLVFSITVIELLMKIGFQLLDLSDYPNATAVLEICEWIGLYLVPGAKVSVVHANIS